MTAELGLNLAGVEKVLEMEQQLARAQRRVELLERRAAELQAEIADARAAPRSRPCRPRPLRGEPGSTIVRAEDVRAPRRTIRIERD